MTATKVRILMRAMLDGPQRLFSEGAVNAVKAVIDPLNAGGGICGRIVELRVVSDTTGTTWSSPMIDDFAGMVGPLQAGFDERLRDGTVDRVGLPLVGTDGLTSAQYASDLVWPVGTSAAAMTRIAVNNAYSLGARTFALVYDKTTAWGTEAEVAFRAFVQRLPGASVRVTTGLDSSKSSYSSEADAFNQACPCDHVLMAVWPDTAERWLQKAPAMGKVQTAGLLFLLSDRFGQDCALEVGNSCEGFRVWTDYTPPSDGTAPFIQGATVGARVLVEALQRVGPMLTRDRLKKVLDEMTYRSDLVHVLDWGPVASGHRGGNESATAVDMQISGAAFRKFEDAGLGWMHDPL